MFNHKTKAGFTLIELLVTIAIIGILVVIAIWSITLNLAKSRDAKRKGDLDRLQIAFEDYYADNQSYPPSDILETCGDDTFKPYLGTIPCDPKTKMPYCYIYDTDNNGQNYRIYSSLEFERDPIIAELNCDDSPDYCGFENECSNFGSHFNYGVTSTNILVNRENIGSGGQTSSPTPTPSPSLGPLPSSNPGSLACTPFGNCDNYTGNPILQNCPITFNNQAQCETYCPTSPTYARCPAN